ncbi:MAG: hypothetical protein ACI4AK_06435 [Lepagella sp.]
MKKIYLSLAAALVVSASASAAIVDAKTLPIESSINTIEAVQTLDKTSDMFKAPAKAAAQADAKGMKAFDCYSRSNAHPGAMTGTVSISFLSDTEVEIMGLFYDFKIKGTFDAAAGTIKVGKQELFLNTYYNEWVTLYPQYLNVNEQGQIESEDYIDYITFVFAPNGLQTSEGDIVYQQCWVADPYEQITISIDSVVDQGSGWEWTYANVLEPLDYRFGEGTEFVFDAAEWEDAGTATMVKDGWLLGDSDPYDVPLLKSKSNEGHFLMVNPFGANTPYASMNETTDTGYIYLNVAEPGCALVRPFVDGGFEYSDWANGHMNFTSLEGQHYYIEGYTIDEVIEEADFFGDPIATYDASTGIVDLPLCRVCFVYAYNNPDQWVDSQTQEPLEMAGQVKLNLGEGAVNNIIDDNAAAAKRYFNLQGIEINAPEAGEVVIVKQGNKTSKVVVK